MAYSSIRSLVVFTIILSLLQCSCGALFKKKPVYEQLTNKLPGQVTLTIHCRFGDQDFGSVKVAPGEYWGFQFRPKFWGKTVVYCSFEWPGHFHYYDIYKKGDGRPGCRDCLWNVIPDGPCLFNYDTKAYDY
ncbi:hypothetical protein EUGRSUZ_H00853, partial [Eucalyptus grandis]